MVDVAIDAGKRLAGRTAENYGNLAVTLLKIIGIGTILLNEIFHLLREDGCIGVVLAKGIANDGKKTITNTL